VRSIHGWPPAIVAAPEDGRSPKTQRCNERARRFPGVLLFPTHLAFVDAGRGATGATESVVLAFGAAGLVAQHEAEQTIHHPWIGVRAADRHVRHNANVAFADDLHQLHHRVTLRAQ
jgi:hypothetical protein